MATTTTTALPVGGTEQSELITVSVNGQTIGTFDTAEGGAALSPSAQHRSGGNAIQTSYRTLPKFSEMVVSRVLNLATDWELLRTLITQAGVVTGQVTKQPIDQNRAAYGNSRTATGMFLGVDEPKTDSDSEALQMLTLHFSVDSWQ